MSIGTVTKFLPERGYGFITPDDGGNDLFVHILQCANGIEELHERQRVEFEQRPSPRVAGKFEAINVRLTQ